MFTVDLDKQLEQLTDVIRRIVNDGTFDEEYVDSLLETQEALINEIAKEYDTLRSDPQYCASRDARAKRF